MTNLHLSMRQPAALIQGFMTLLLLLLLALCYAPGLDSAFIFDDFPNLETLAQISPYPYFSEEFWEFVGSGESGSLGRPLSLLTFAFQAESWVAGNAQAFKLLNLVIHLANTLLIFFICRLLSGRLGIHNNFRFYFSLLVTAIWAFHPMQSATVLYTVQRMTLLSAFFQLISVMVHLHFRAYALSGRLVNWLLYTAGIAIPAFIALFCKENAPAVLFLLLAIEYSAFADTTREIPQVVTAIRRWRLLVLWLPALVLLLAPLLFLDQLHAAFAASRDFTMLERALTQPRVLWSYLLDFLLPSTTHSALFHGVEVSTSLLSPVVTAIALASWSALFIAALIKRHRFPIFSIAVFWFLGAHVIESTILPLELHFRHRNYLAILGPALLTGWLLLELQQRSTAFSRQPAIPGAILVAILAFQTLQAALLWRSPLDQAAQWYVYEPTEIRNAENLAINLQSTSLEGQFQAARIYDDLIAAHPDQLRLAINRLLLNCINPGLPQPDPMELMEKFTGFDRLERDLIAPITQFSSLTMNGQCSVLDLTQLQQALEAMVPQLEGEPRGQILFELARLAQLRNENATALELYQEAWELTGDAGVLFARILLLAEQQRFQEALAQIDVALASLDTGNLLASGTRNQKRQILLELREQYSASI